MSNLAREPLQIVEIDMDYCVWNYGLGGCPAVLGTDSVRKCYNTYFTCPVQANFNKTTLTLRFAQNISGLPKGQTIFPALQSVTTNPSMITLGAVDDRTGSLGKRARVTVSLKDFTYDDALTDKYVSERRDGTAQTDEAGYEPGDRGTFFGKMRRRFPYYFGRSLRVKNGFVGDDIASMPTLHYVITEWKGPDASGKIQITAQDPLKLADEDYSLCPRPSSGVIPADVDASGTPVFNILPAGAGPSYEVSGYALVGSEIVSYTRAFDTFTITARGVGGTVPEVHAAGDTFQQVYSVINATPEAVIAELLQDYADLPASWIDEAVWATEIRRWSPNLRFTRLITEPTPVVELLSQIMDMGFILWSDVSAGKIRVRANRPLDLGEEMPRFSDADAFIEGTTSRQDLDDQRLSQVWAIHSMINYADNQTSTDNYRVAEVLSDLEAEGDVEYAQSRIHKFYLPWLGRDARPSQADIIAARLLTRYRDTPQQVSAQVDISRKNDLDLANLIEIESRLLQDETGNSVVTGMQVTSIDEIQPGNRMSVTAQSHKLDGRWGFVMQAGYPNDYDGASALDIAEGCFMIDSPTETTFPDGTGPYIMF